MVFIKSHVDHDRHGHRARIDRLPMTACERFYATAMGVATAELIGTVDPRIRMFARAIEIAGGSHMINARKGPVQNNLKR